MKQKVLKGRTPEDRIRVIHTGLDLAQFETGESRIVVRAKFSYSDHNIVIGTVSRLFKEKGHRILIDAVKLLAGEFPKIRLLIVGTGDERPALEQHAMACGIRDKVTFTGFHKDLPGVLNAMDIFAQPSILEEGFPTAVLEAQVAGLPVVASDIGGTSETINEGITGLLAIPGSDTDLAETLRKLLSDSELRNSMAAAARPWIENSFTLDHMIEKIADTYHEAYNFYHDTTPNKEDPVDEDRD
jgi:glycosyltransferase involved in cell wall biosynthesis